MALDAAAVRAAYPALADGYAYLDGAAGTQVPEAVIDAISAAYRAGLGNAGGAFPASERSVALTAECRQAVADLTGGAPDGSHPRAEHDHAHLPAGGGAGGRLGAGRRGGRLAAGPRRQRAALGAGRPAGRGGRPVGGGRRGHRGTARRAVRRAAVRAHPAGGGDGRQQRAGHPARRGRDHRPGPRGRRAQLRGRRARHPAFPGRRGGARRGLLRDQRLQVVGPARGGGDRGPGAAGAAAPGQADPRPGHRAGAVRAGHAAVRRPGRGERRRGPPRPAGRPGARQPPGAAARLDGGGGRVRGAAVRRARRRPGRDERGDQLRQGGPPGADRLLHGRRARPGGGRPAPGQPRGSTCGPGTTTPGS